MQLCLNPVNIVYFVICSVGDACDLCVTKQDDMISINAKIWFCLRPPAICSTGQPLRLNTLQKQKVFTLANNFEIKCAVLRII